MQFVSTLIERYINGAWNNISSSVVGDIEGEYLIPSPDADEMLASVGQLKFLVNNGDGSFSPNSLFNRGTPIKITTTYDGTSKIKFAGNILYLDPDTGDWGDQYTEVTCVDWLKYAVDHPISIPEIQANMTVDQAVAYLLSLMTVQPGEYRYEAGREVFPAVFDTIKKDTKAYSELHKLAMSEFAPIYMRAGNILVVESANTRIGTRELTQIPVSPSQSSRLLKEDGGFLLKEDGGKILLDEAYAPNLSGTFTKIKIEAGRSLTNEVVVRVFPARLDASPVVLFQLDEPIQLPTLSTIGLKGTWANPDGGSPINAQNIVSPMVTGTDYQANANYSGTGADLTANLLIGTSFGAEGFQAVVTNTGNAAWLTRFSPRGYGIYPYNPQEFLINVSGSISAYGVKQMQIDQKYQDDLQTAIFIGTIVVDDEKEPRNRLMWAEFDASSTPQLMQASQYMDIGDLTYVSNSKPSMDTYAYIHGKKFTISPAGAITERWYLKEMDSLRKGLKPISLRFSGLVGSANGVNFGTFKKWDNLPQRTWSACIYMRAGTSQGYIISKSDDTEITGNDLYIADAPENRIEFSREWSGGQAMWATITGSVASLGDAWHRVTVTYDQTSVNNDPIIYVDGVSYPIVEHASPVGTPSDDSTGNLILGNVNLPSAAYVYNFNASIKDARMYDVILTPAQVVALPTNPVNYADFLQVPDGLIFQAPAVKTEDYAGMTGTALYPHNKIIDNIFSVRGTPNWNFPSGTAWAVKAYDVT